MKRLAAGFAAGLLAAVLGACAGANRGVARSEPRTVTPPPPSSATTMVGVDAGALIADWPKGSQDAARAMLSRYGQPEVVSNVMLLWRDRAPFTTITVTRDGVRRDFPAPHAEILTQEVKLAVPVDKLAELARFDGSLIVDRTRGTVAARSDREANNLLALNLADEIVSGKRDAASARQAYVETLEKQMAGKSSPYLEKLQFSLSGPTANPDHPVKLPPAP